MFGYNFADRENIETAAELIAKIIIDKELNGNTRLPVATYATSGALASNRDALRADSDLRAYGHQRDGTAGTQEASTAAIAAGPRHYQ